MKKNILSILTGIAIAIVTMQFVQPVVVNGISMSPYLEDGDFLVMEKINKTPDYDDIIVFTEGNRLLIKRVVGKPGDTVSFKDNEVYVNGEKRQEEYIPYETRPGEDTTLGEGEYYVLGDNRPDSMDSRELGPITKDKIKGIAKIRLYPGPQKL